MKDNKNLVAGIAVMLLICFFSQSQAVTSTSASGMVQERKSQVKIFKVVYFIAKIKNEILYLENKQRYNLSNVKVTRLSGGTNHISDKKRTAEMLFVDGILKEVIIR